MRVLVTGATGFVGGAVARQLAHDGHDVRALARPNSDTRRLVDDGIEVVEGDVRDRPSLAVAMTACSHVIHLAAAKRGSAALLDDVNVYGTANVVNAARVAGVQRFVFGSTMGVHGFVTGGTLDERSPINPNTPYRRSKWQGEQVARDAHAHGAVPVVVARISTVVGNGAMGWVPLARDVAAGRLRLIGDGALGTWEDHHRGGQVETRGDGVHAWDLVRSASKQNRNIGIRPTATAPRPRSQNAARNPAALSRARG